MAKVELNQDVCVGCGMCAANAEKYFEFGDNGLSHVKQEEVDPEDLETLKETSELCPTEAITIVED